MTSISDELRQAVSAAAGRPVEVVDPETNTVYVLITQEMFGQLSKHAAEDLSEDERRSLLVRSGIAAGWDDPLMDDYDNYDKFKS